jgi:hypothetical protein
MHRAQCGTDSFAAEGKRVWRHKSGISFMPALVVESLQLSRLSQLTCTVASKAQELVKVPE